MQRSKNDLWVGLFVMLGAVALVFLALQSANLLRLNFQSGYRITARFDNIGGLKPQTAVKSADCSQPWRSGSRKFGRTAV